MSIRKDDRSGGKFAATINRKKNREYEKLNAEIEKALVSAATARKIGETVSSNADEIVVIDAMYRRSEASAPYRDLVNTLLEWVNSELSSERMIVRSLDEDFNDGLVLAKLTDKLYGSPQLQSMSEVIASEAGRKQRIRTVLQVINEQMQVPEDRAAELPWSLDLIYGQNEVALVSLLLALARHSRAPVRLPDSLTVPLVIVQRLEGGMLQTVRKEVDIALSLEFTLARGETDAFDTLFDETPDKIPQVTRALSMWLNNHLKHLDVDVDDLSVLADGVYLVMLVGLLEGFFVPLFAYHVAPCAVDERISNVKLAMELLTDAGVDLPARVRPADIVNADMRSIIRFVYHVFQFYSNRERERAYAAVQFQPEPAATDDAAPVGPVAETETETDADLYAEVSSDPVYSYSAAFRNPIPESDEEEDDNETFLPPPGPDELLGAP